MYVRVCACARVYVRVCGACLSSCPLHQFLEGELCTLGVFVGSVCVCALCECALCGCM